jgi:inosine-uridine nucleoside N-ribohydrolase
MATWVGLDVTRRVRMTRREAAEMAAEMAADPHPFTAFAGRYSVAWIDHLRATDDPATDSCPLHDPLAVAAVTRPDLLTLTEVNLEVQREGVARGVMVADHRTSTDRPANARIAVDVDPPGFADHFTGCLRRLS